VHHAKGGHFDDEGWRGPCGVNEVTCHVSGFGSQGLLSFDWKHFPFEDYDSWFWGNEVLGFCLIKDNQFFLHSSQWVLL
jgi:hypothetical protein